MTAPNDDQGVVARDNVLAGEYVLGVLSSGARLEVEARIRRDTVFADLVARWQENLVAFNEAYSPVEPPQGLLDSIEQRLFPPASVQAKSWIHGLWDSVLLWRLTAATLFLLLVGYGLFNASFFAPHLAEAPLVAELSGEGAAVGLFARYDAQTGRLSMMPVATDAPSQERSLELWLVPGDNAPTISLGVLPQSGDGAIEVPASLRARITEGVTLAVSLEPLGGSSTGQATGPVIAVGQTRRP